MCAGVLRGPAGALGFDERSGGPMTLRAWLRAITPPIIWNGLAAVRHRLGTPEYEWMPAGWTAAQANPRVKGWNAAGVAAAYEAGWLGFVQSLAGSGPFVHAPNALHGAPPDLAFHNSVMSFGYVLALAAHSRAGLAMLDWGGGA